MTLSIAFTAGSLCNKHLALKTYMKTNSYVHLNILQGRLSRGAGGAIAPPKIVQHVLLAKN